MLMIGLRNKGKHTIKCRRPQVNSRSARNCCEIRTSLFLHLILALKPPATYTRCVSEYCLSGVTCDPRTKTNIALLFTALGGCGDGDSAFESGMQLTGLTVSGKINTIHAAVHQL